MKDAPEYLSKRAATVYTSLSARTLDAAKAAGELPFYRFGLRKVLFKRSDLDRWLAPLRVDITTGGRA